MSAAFISMIENGRATPSPAKLQLIAKRLQKPVEYFTADFSDVEETAYLLLEGARQDQRNGDLPKAQRRLLQALRVAEQTQNIGLQARIHLDIASGLSGMGQFEEAMERCETAIDLIQLSGKENLSDLIEALFQLGSTQFLAEDFAGAKRTYTRVLRMTAGLKTRADVAMRAQCYLASCLGRLGDIEGSAEVSRELIQSCDPGAHPSIWVEAALGLSAALYRKGKLEEALGWARKAVTVCQNTGSSALVLAEHNVAVIEARRGNWETAYVMMRRCLAVYRDTGRHQNTASILEEMANYWRHKKDLNKAEATCREGLAELDKQDSTVQRGRLYRILGEIYLARNNLIRARELFEISREFFRKTRTREELEQVERISDQIQQKIEAQAIGGER